jgi:diguanylate cyclase (GGDEF)-like protein/PAS domain S-box-containing protein
MFRHLLLLLALVCSLQTPAALSSQQEPLTGEELAWLEAHPTIRLGIDPDWAPFEYYDEQQIYRGIAADYIALLSHKLGVTMEPVHGLSWSEVLEAAANQRLDVLPAAMATAPREKYLHFTSPYLDFPMVIITRADAPFVAGLDALEDNRVAVVKGYVSHDLLVANHPRLTLTPFTTIRDSLSALSTGEVDAFVGNLASASHAINQLGLTNLKVAAHTPYSFKLGMGVRNDWPQLATILEKSLRNLTAEEVHGIQQKWVHLQVAQGLNLLEVMTVAGPLLAAALLIFLVMIRSNRTLRREIKERQQVENNLLLSEKALLDSQSLTHIGNYVWDIKNNETTWSQELYCIVGWGPENFKPSYENYLNCIHPDDREDFTALTATVLNSTEPYSNEYRITRPNGEVRYVFEKGHVYRDEAGNPTRLVGVIHDITERKLTEIKLRKQAFFDELTDLPNRNYFMEQLGKSLAQARRHNHLCALLFFDLDNFKIINDTLGHHTGDKLLAEIGKRIIHGIRQEDTAARLGGDEFVIIATHLGRNHERAAEQARLIAEEIHDLLSVPFSIEGHEHHITLSTGISLFPVAHEDINDILKFADTAMYRAKESGRNAIRFFQPSIQQAAEERFELHNKLRQALQGDEFELHYQPQYNSECRIIGAESLLRWHQPELGMVSPARFIPLAEESGLILDIGIWVLQEACRQLTRWDDQGIDIETLAVNVSPRQFHQPDFAAQVQTIIRDSGIDATRLELELTEGVLVENIDDIINKMGQLKQMGIRFAVDDFGTGYSSLRYLQQLPLDRLKIDQSFVRDIQHTGANTLIVETIISMANHLGLELIAEGVETIDELKFLKLSGCNNYQGFYFSKPLPAQQLTERLLARNQQDSENVQ